MFTESMTANMRGLALPYVKMEALQTQTVTYGLRLISSDL